MTLYPLPLFPRSEEAGCILLLHEGMAELWLELVMRALEVVVLASRGGSTKWRACAKGYLRASSSDISVSEFFAKNRHLLGFDTPSKALLTTIKEKRQKKERQSNIALIIVRSACFIKCVQE